MSEEQPVYAEDYITNLFEEWWDKDSTSGTIVIVSANEYLHMKSIAHRAYIEGFNKGRRE